MTIIVDLASIDNLPNGQLGDKKCGLFLARSLHKLRSNVFLFSFRVVSLKGLQARTQVSPTNKNSTPRHPLAWETREAQPVCAW